MKIQVKHKGKSMYIQNKPVRKAPVLTPFWDRAWDFTNLAKCKNVRDDILEYFPKNATIVA